MNLVLLVVAIILLTYFVNSYIRKHNLLQSRKLIFVGDDQYIFIYIFLFIALVATVSFVIIHTNIFSIITLLLIIICLIFTLFKKLSIPIICALLVFITSWIGEFGTAESVTFPWYISIIFVSTGIVLLIIISIWDSNNLVKKPWINVLDSLHRKGASEAEIEKFKEYWTKYQMSINKYRH